MATESVEQRSAHIRAVTVTALASLSGVAAGVLSSAIAEAANDPTALFVLAGLVLFQFPVLKVSGIVEEFSTKDQLFIAFMTFCLWFVTWGILLTTGASLSI